MHLLAAQPGSISDGSDAIDLGQTPGDVVVLSAADTELSALAAAHARLGTPFALRLANLTRLGHHMSVDVYLDRVIAHARLVVVRLLGGRSYWPYGIGEIADLCRRRKIALACLPGDDRPDADMFQSGTMAAEQADVLWRYLVHGGPENGENFLRLAGHLAGLMPRPADPPRPLPPAGLYPGPDWQAGWSPDRPGAVVVFYRALVLAGDCQPVDHLLAALRGRGMNALGVYVQSLKDGTSAALLRGVLAESGAQVVLNATGFAVASPGPNGSAATPFSDADCPVLQVVLAGSDRDSWQDGNGGLAARDIAMNVALPEVDGRILARAISFKQARRDEATQCDIARHGAVADRVDFAADLALAWAQLRRIPAADRRIGIILANYPGRDGRLGNGVGLDTPASVVAILHALAGQGYGVAAPDFDGNALIRRLETVRTETLPLSDYLDFLRTLPQPVQDRLAQRWGPPQDDPDVVDGAFHLRILRLGHMAVGLQPDRGRGDDAARFYHDPAQPPPHGYLAFYVWLRRSFAVHAVVHVGKHGNLEWLPGKSLALSDQCFPEIALGPLPNLYPFIVNDPGEGTQAKRRAAAVIIGHLTPPLTRAESYGPLRELERLVDEYYDASGLDPRRLAILRRDILDMTAKAGLDRDLGITAHDDSDTALAKLDNHLCELKELQIRDGLHVFGQSPTGEQRANLLVALARVGRGVGAGDGSVLRALADDLGLGFDPLDCHPADVWTGPRPTVLSVGDGPWRSQGDTVERLERLALDLVTGQRPCAPDWSRTALVLEQILTRLAPAVDGCGQAEMAGLLRGLDGRFVPPGPSGAPTRGRPDVLPTGRNFFSVDSRTVPTPAAWALGWKSAQLLLERHLQDHGDWPRAMALTAWGTANMRTGGDDIAQGLALMGVRPCWDDASRRVTGFEIMPAGILDRPRVDVTLRVSGFFRDAFPDLINLFDSAARAVAGLDEDDATNPLAARVRADTARLGAARAGARVFGSAPGAYGAGLDALLDGDGWGQGADQLGDSYVAWGDWVYGHGADGDAGQGLFRDRLEQVQAVVHNQDNREHDLLDSDGYYQFEGGLAAAVRRVSGQAPVVYHADHSRPETPRIGTLDEEIARIMRARVVNPKWIGGMMRHGYKGAFEMAATVDFMFAFAATTGAVKSHHFDLVAGAYLDDAQVRDFLETNNPAALANIRARLRQALERGFWHPRRNSLTDIID